MARLPRYFVPGQPQHIILRGNNRQTIFAAEQDYLFFRDLLTCMRYVEENPVRVGMVVNPGAYRWSSYPANALGKLGFNYDWLLPHPLYQALGRDADGRRQAYRRLFRAEMKETDLKAIRDSLHKGWALGDD